MVLTPETKTFRDISQNLNEIPDLQREFDWKKENADRLFTDLWDFCDDYQGGDMYYFLGSMIVYREENQRNFQVVDGQQRLGSLCLMMRCRERSVRRWSAMMPSKGAKHDCAIAWNHCSHRYADSDC